jgi:hypothetical protein
VEDLFDLFDLFEVQPEGSLWRGAVNGRQTASSKLAELFAKSGKPVFAMNLQTREILEFAYPEKQASSGSSPSATGYSLLWLRDLIKQPPPPTEPYKPPKEEFPPNPYVPLAHR